MNAVLSHQIAMLSIPERLHLIDDLWSSVEKNQAISEQQLHQILENRYQDSLNHPDTPTSSLKQIASRFGVEI